MEWVGIWNTVDGTRGWRFSGSAVSGTLAAGACRAVFGEIDTDRILVAGAESAPPEALPEAATALGMTLEPNGDGSGGLLIQNVDGDSPAAQRGFATGDVILEVDNKPVSEPGDFDQAVQAVRDRGLNTVLIKIARDGEARFVGLPIGETE